MIMTNAMPIDGLGEFDCSKDAILLAGKEAILSKFRNFDSSLVFAADKTCSPDEFLAVSVSAFACF